MVPSLFICPSLSATLVYFLHQFVVMDFWIYHCDGNCTNSTDIMNWDSVEVNMVVEIMYGLGRCCSNVFKPSSKYLPQLFFFFNEKDEGDCMRLVQTCRLLQQSVKNTG
jgi:hypothetical protein